MRPDDLATAIYKKREALQQEIFAAPPKDYEDFLKRLGIWLGLGESLRIIEDARKSERDD